MSEIDISRVFPNWKIVRRIGKGGFGAVYEIERSQFGRTEKAALKTIRIPADQSIVDEMRAEGYNKSSIKKRLEDELNSLVDEYYNMKKLIHTNVVNCDDMEYEEVTDGIGYNVYIKMELLTPLERHLAIRNDINIQEETVKIGMDICNALVLCEQKKIVHRDIKPQNILISETGVYKLGDFGIARTMEHATNATRTGTYKYMAPEVYNNRPYDHRIDIYSLGLVLYWMLNEKRMPFLPLPPAVPTYSHEEEAKARRFRGDILPQPKNGSAELKKIVLKACAFNLQDRYQSAEDMLKDLAAIQNNAGAYHHANTVFNGDAEYNASSDESTVGGAYGSGEKPQDAVDETVGVNKRANPDDIVDGEYHFSKYNGADNSQNKYANSTSGASSPHYTETNDATYPGYDNTSDSTIGNSWDDSSETVGVNRANNRKHEDDKTVGVHNSNKSSNAGSGNSDKSRSAGTGNSNSNDNNPKFSKLERLKSVPVPKKDGIIVTIFALILASVIPMFMGAGFGFSIAGPGGAMIGAVLGLALMAIVTDPFERKIKLIGTETGVKVNIPAGNKDYFVLALNGTWIASGVYSGYEVKIDKRPAKVVLAKMTIKEKSSGVSDVKVEHIKEVEIY